MIRDREQEWGKLIHTVSFRWATIRVMLISLLLLFWGMVFSVGLRAGNILLGIIGVIFIVVFIIFILSSIKRFNDLHFDVYENGLWFDLPTYWFWQKRPPDERYFRSFDDIIDVDKKVTGSYRIFIHTKSEGTLQYAVYKKQGPELMNAITEAMIAYEDRKSG